MDMALLRDSATGGKITLVRHWTTNTDSCARAPYLLARVGIFTSSFDPKSRRASRTIRRRPPRGAPRSPQLPPTRPPQPQPRPPWSGRRRAVASAARQGCPATVPADAYILGHGLGRRERDQRPRPRPWPRPPWTRPRPRLRPPWNGRMPALRRRTRVRIPVAATGALGRPLSSLPRPPRSAARGRRRQP